jgi:N4-(beta-N-acetylglucosaminyl)-L-asparaginase
MNFTRRDFLATATLSSASAALGSRANAQMPNMNHVQHGEPKAERPAVPRLPTMICKVTGTLGIDAAYKMLEQGSDTLDASLHVCKTQEDDPNDHSTGLGGLPNADGEVYLDACCIHGPTRRDAAVASVSGVRNASLLARALMDHTGNALLVGSGAEAFALAHGFNKEELLTDRTRKNYVLWKQLQSNPELPNSQKDLDMLIRKIEPLAAQIGLGPAATWRASLDAVAPAAEPLYVSAVDRKGQVSAVSTSSGQPWRIAGASSDVAMIGAGCYVDPDVGSAGGSGNAEANIKIAGAHTIVENMCKGMSPEDAGMDALRRIARWYNHDMRSLRSVEMVYYILRKDGAYGSVSLWQGDRTNHQRQFTVKDGEWTRRTEDCLFLFPSSPLNAI